MEDRTATRGEEAGAWLRRRYEHDPEPQVSITWEITEPNDAVFHEVLDILFKPEPGEPAA